MKHIPTPQALEAFRASDTYKSLLKFIVDVGQQLPESLIQTQTRHPVVDALKRCVLDRLHLFMDEHPPVPGHDARFGNPAFRDWHAKLCNESAALLTEALPDDERRLHFVEQVVPYIDNAFGNSVRIDYGSGHELNFACFLYCLAAAGYVSVPNDAVDLALHLFPEYLKVTRKLQRNYLLEPAGSRGVWGIDDYHFLPFLWGAYQLKESVHFRPCDAICTDVVRQHAEEYLYFGAVNVILENKNAPLAVTSPILCDISNVPVWHRVASGFVKMYEGEVLCKFPVMQHFICCDYLPFDYSSS